MNKELWKNLSFPNAGEYGANFNAESVGFATMLKKALSNDTDCIFSFKKEGNFKSELDKTSKQIMSEYLIKNGGRLISRSFNDIDLFIWEDSIVELNAPNNYLLIEAYSFNQTFINDFKDFCEDNHIPIEKKGQVFAIVKQGSGFGLSAIGIAGLPLIESNYEPQIMEDYKYVINDLNLKDPSGRISIFRGLAGSGKCVAEGTLIVNAKNGILEPIEKIVADKQKVLSFDFNTNKVVHKKPSDWLNMGTKECLEIQLKSGNKLTGTPEHPIMTVDGWKKLSELSTNDCIAQADKIPFPKNLTHIEDEEVYILAGLLAEGSYSQNYVGFSNDDKAIVKLMNKSLAKIVDGKLKHYDYHKSFDYRISSPKIDRDTKIRLLLNKYRLGHTLAKHKTIPDEIFSLNEDKLAKFIGLMWSCDGSIEKDGTITYSSASEKMINQMQHLLLRYGIFSNKRYKIAKCNGKEFDAWEIVVLSTCKDIFKNKIPLVGAKTKLLSQMLIYHNPNDDLIPLTNNIKSKLITISKEFMASGGIIADMATILGRNRKNKFSVSSLIEHKSISKRTLAAFIKLTKNTKLQWLLSMRWSKVEKISQVGVKQVYDLTIPDNHCFIANDIVVHNTHMIRAMLNLVHNAMFVLVSPELVTELSGPNIMPLLLQYRGGTTGPIVLLIEDADKCLTSRKDNNLNEIHSLLNLGDGILGSMLDLRIVATTNAAELNIEKAISRPGRLSKMITVDALSYATACGVFTRLLPNQTGKLLPLQLKNKTSYKELTLAEVYALARKNGWVPPKQPQIIEDTDDKYYDN